MTTDGKPELRLFDTHCHFDFAPFAADFPSELASAQQQGVVRFVIPAIGPQNWPRVQQLAAQFPASLYYALGLHPYFLQPDWPDPLSQLERQLAASTSACVAIGECGLDAIVDTPAQLQESLLLGQLAIAQAARLPVILHSRKTHNRLLQLLKQARFNAGGVLHAFAGSAQQAQQFVDIGFKIGVGGSITYPRANKTRQAVAGLPLEHIVLETDAPDMPLCGFQGRRNHPRQLPRILSALAELRQCDEQSLANEIWQNSNALFNICE